MIFNVRLHSLIIINVTFILLQQISGKIFERCELARLLKNNYRLPKDEIANWVCIAQYQSRFNSSLQSGSPDNGAHGIFQISDQYWCSPPGKGLACGITCDKLRDDDLTDDLICAQIIYAEHERISNDGFNAWTTYQQFCKGKAYNVILNCFNDDTDPEIDVRSQMRRSFGVSKSHSKTHKSKGKVFKRCELAVLLRNTYGLSFDEVANLVCIAQYQSGFNSSALTGTVDNGSHGLFQINDVHWCSSHTGRSQGCAMTCDRLRDDDLTDDLACVRIIYDEHQRISGDGYDAWSTYQPHCKGKAYNTIQDCFNEDEFTKPASPVRGRVQSKPVSFNRIDTIDNSLAVYEIKDKIYYGKVYSRCELAQELYYNHNIPMNQIATWVCIAKHESNYNTSAVGRLNIDGSEDHGLFQISDIYWCSPPGTGWACGLSCSQLEDSDITDDVECIKIIYEEHEKISGDGFTAWTVYKPYCQGRSDEYIRGCFNEFVDNSIAGEYYASYSAKVTTEKVPHATIPKAKKKPGKIYTPCELAQELKEKHKIPEYQIAVWVCIAKYESNFNTSALGYGDHGLFQISQIYWCSPSGRGRACELSCSDLKDDDITDDVQCIKKIYEEHTRLSGDGFNAWTVYQQFCSRGRSEKYIENCNGVIYNDPDKYTTTRKSYPTVPKPIYTQPPTNLHRSSVSTSKSSSTAKQEINRSHYSSPTKQTTKSPFNTLTYGKPQSKGSPSYSSASQLQSSKSLTTKTPFQSLTQSLTSSSKKSAISSKKPWWEHQSTQPQSSGHSVRFGVLYDSESSQIQSSLPSPSAFGTSSTLQRNSQYPYAPATNSVTQNKIPSTKPGQSNKAATKSTNKSQTKIAITPYKAPITTKSPATKSSTKKSLFGYSYYPSSTTTVKSISTLNSGKSTTSNNVQTTRTKAAYNSVFDVYFNLYNVPSPFKKTPDDKRSANYNSFSSKQNRITTKTTTRRSPTTKPPLSSFNSHFLRSTITTTTRKPKPATNQIRNTHASTTTKHSTKTTNTRPSIGATSTIVSGSKVLNNGVKAYYFTISNNNSSHSVRSPRSSQQKFTHPIYDPPTQNPSLSKQIEAPLQDVDTTTKSS